MPIVRLDVAYDGTDFRGWAAQPRQRTVEGVLRDALGRALGEVPKLSVAGRTDAGVHARGQVVSFEAPDGTDPSRLQRIANGIMAPEVVVLAAAVAPDGFNARFSATAREYRYRIATSPVADPFTSRFVWHRPGIIRTAPMRAAARVLVGEHDFASFCRKPQSGPTVRNLRTLAISADGRLVSVRAVADSFLHQMVRSLVGMLVRVGEGAIDPGSVASILEARDRAGTGNLAPARGLTLESVSYGVRHRRG
jgi:tRNA pseudouridine38-40 synthase